MPLYDTSIVHLMKGPLYEKEKRLKSIQYEDLCTVYGIETQKFQNERSSNIRPLENELVRKYAFQVEHLMTIMQEQLADESSEENQKIMRIISNRINGVIKEVEKSRAKSNQKKSTQTDYIVTVVVQTEISKKIIQVFIIFRSVGLETRIKLH